MRKSLILLVLSVFPMRLFGAPSLPEIYNKIDTLRHEVENHEAELRMFEERVANQQSALDALRQQIIDGNQAHRNLMQGTSASLEAKISSIENINKSLVSDLGQFRTHANDTANALTQFKQKISDLEKQVQTQSKNIELLQKAMKSLTAALQNSDDQAMSSYINTDDPGAKLYRVKPGDSLDKIARNNQTTVKAIKERNKLKNDHIFVGQVLHIP